MVYVDFRYYKNKYFGALPEDSFNSVIVRASREIDNNINTQLTENKINSLSKEAQEQLKDTACALIDLFYQKKESDDRKVSSISIDGVSKSFKNISNTDYVLSLRSIIQSLPDQLTKYI